MTQPLKATDYQVIRTINPAELTFQVKKRIAEGWLLYGPPMVVNDSLFSQALVKVEREIVPYNA